MFDTDTKVIAVCAADIDDEYNTLFLERFRSLADEYHFKVLCFYSFSSLFAMTSHEIGECNIFQLINYELIDGMIVLSQSIEAISVLDAIIQKAQTKGIPTVSIDYLFDSCYNVGFDYDQAMYNIVTHLIEKHDAKTLNFMAGMKDNIYSQKRESIFRKVMAEHHLPVEEDRISYGDFWSQPTLRAMDEFYASGLPLPDAFVCANDTMAITVIDSLKSHGYTVPDDLMVTGFDGIREALNFVPSITSAQRDITSCAQASFQVLADIFQGKSPEHAIWITPTFQLGASCGCIIQKPSLLNALTRSLYSDIEQTKSFSQRQISMMAELTDKASFHEVFENIKKYVEDFEENHFWLCIVDNFLTEEEELSDLLEQNSAYVHSGYSCKTDLMLYHAHSIWQGITDFDTSELLPGLTDILSEIDNIIFFPMHVHEQTIGYAAISLDEHMINFIHCNQFFMNVSNALEVTKSRQRQQMIIASLENKYVHDPMTGLFNRRGFYQRIEKVYQHCVEEEHLFFLISADLNGLKPINDTYGHSDGDIAISTVAKALMVCAQKNETCARFGGDEFVVAGQVESDHDADDYLDRIQHYIDQFNETSGKPYQVSASIGFVLAVPTISITLDEFISLADEKMYAEKAKHHMSRSR